MKKKLSAFTLALLLALPFLAGAVYTNSLINLVLRYNALCGDQLSLIESVAEPKVGKEFDAYTISLNKYAALAVQTSSGTNNILEAMVFASGDGSAMAGARIMQTLGAFCGALGFIDKLDQSYEFLEKAGLFKDGALDGRLNKYQVDHHTITFAQIKGVGLMFTVVLPEK